MLDFNHAMIYTRDVSRSLPFYRDLLGFTLVDDFEWEGRPVYARLKAPRGEGTIALHALEPGKDLGIGGIRLYFETTDLDTLCARLESAGVVLKQKPTKMPWGWTHAYLDDPDGHEVSLYDSHGLRLRGRTE